MMTKRLKALVIALAVLGTAAIVVNVYGLLRSPKKTITAIDMATGEIKQLTPDEDRAIRDEIKGKREKYHREETEKQ
ncbi:MAG TPA: hypothetical protein ACFYEM_01255 [Candidatus Hypogeohydataceae bacterium YC40]